MEIVQVLVVPQTIEIFADDPESHKTTLTLYNPYDYALDFQVFSTRRDDFIVTDPKGVVKSKSLKKFMVCHVADPKTNGQRSKLRIYTWQHKTKRFKKSQDIVVSVYATKPLDTSSTETENFEQLLPKPSHVHAQQCSISSSPKGGGPSFYVILLAILCISALMLPTDGVDHSSLPSYFHLTISQKLIFAYILGHITQVIIRP